jgi:uncharacterized phiE125 gp8 family phage protein
MLRLITAPTADVLTLAETKAHLRVDEDDEDAVIAGLIAAATARLDGRDGILGRCLAEQTWELGLAAFPAAEAGAILLPLPPTIAVDSVKYLDGAGAEQTISSALYAVSPGGIAGDTVLPLAGSWDYLTAARPDAVRIRFRAGYATLPKNIRLALLLMIGDWFEHRGTAVVGQSVAELANAADALLAPYRLYLPC